MLCDLAHSSESRAWRQWHLCPDEQRLQRHRMDVSAKSLGIICSLMGTARPIPRT